MRMKFGVLVGAVVLRVADGCVHDLLNHRLVTQEQHYSDDHPFIVAEQRRRLDTADATDADPRTQSYKTDDAFAPIRIVPYWHSDLLHRRVANKSQ
ncbi:TPA: hypothetical protein N0F65_010138 [Lagenidium giganteum]|uniref:Secreted protein n=1 Tax=Lagenidium giganteum TaxID=4803 RepID=A0AAV2Z8Y6_9STRA|nr:TPA: hypothetical protein N0F65_010138 [Lagenidium giganteum]